MAAPTGNRNKQKGRMVFDALHKIAAREKMPPVKTNMDRLARALWKKAEDGDTSAIREICDRLDGKPHQTTEHTGSEGGPIAHAVEVHIVDPKG